MTDTTITLHGTRRGGLLDWLRRSYAEHKLYRQTLNELQSLSDRELNDIGISRLVVKDVAHHSVYGA